MRVRLGYVSNSSSSSFLLLEYTDRKKVEEVMDSIVSFWGHDGFDSSCYSIREITDDFVRGLKERGFNEEAEIAMPGCFRVTSEWDNSIPYELFGIISDKLNAYEFYIGYDFEE